MQHAQNGLGKCQWAMLQYSYSNNERQQMSNLMTIPHTVTFEATIDLDKIPAPLLPALLSLDEKAIQEMCKGATVSALSLSNVLTVANENNTWAELTVKEGN
jgi:hypothetical protein